MASIRFGAVLFLVLLSFSGLNVVQSFHNPLASAAADTKVEPLAAAATNTANSTSTSNSCTGPIWYGDCLDGVWENGSNASITYSVNYSCNGSEEGLCYLSANYTTDPVCPSMEGASFITEAIPSGRSNSSALLFTNDKMYQCGHANNPVVINCSQPIYWLTTFNATVSPTVITGTWLDQNWNITSCTIIPPSFQVPFTLIHVVTSSSTSGSTTAGTSQQSSSPAGGQGSSPFSSQSSSSSSSSTSATTTKSGGTPTGWLIIAVAAVVLVAGIGIGVIFLRKRP